ncbi:hypothetical protein AB3K78_10970 [Leucobacter sp. HNU]
MTVHSAAKFAQDAPASTAATSSPTVRATTERSPELAGVYNPFEA